MPTLSQILALDLYPEERLQTVPRALIDEIARFTLEALAERVAPQFRGRIDDVRLEWTACEACGVVLPGDVPEVVRDVELATVLCSVCSRCPKVEEKGAAS